MQSDAGPTEAAAPRSAAAPAASAAAAAAQTCSDLGGSCRQDEVNQWIFLGGGGGGRGSFVSDVGDSAEMSRCP